MITSSGAEDVGEFSEVVTTEEEEIEEFEGMITTGRLAVVVVDDDGEVYGGDTEDVVVGAVGGGLYEGDADEDVDEVIGGELYEGREDVVVDVVGGELYDGDTDEDVAVDGAEPEEEDVEVADDDEVVVGEFPDVVEMVLAVVVTGLLEELLGGQ